MRRMGHFRLLVMVLFVLRTSNICLGHPIDFIIDGIFEKISQQEIEDTFKTDKELLCTLFNNSNLLYEKLIEKSDPESKISKIFLKLCTLTIPDFKSSFSEGQNFKLTKNQVYDYWLQAITQVIVYYCELVYPDTKSSSDYLIPGSVSNSEDFDFEEDYF